MLDRCAGEVRTSGLTLNRGRGLRADRHGGDCWEFTGGADLGADQVVVTVRQGIDHNGLCTLLLFKKLW